MAPQKKPFANHTILIVDESIRGDYFILNNPGKNTSNFFEKNVMSIYNFGIASSFTNSSYSSNYAIISGLSLNELPDNEQKSRKRATVFDYANVAGLSAYHLYGQTDWRAQTYIPENVKRFNIRKMYPEIKNWLVDRQIIKELKQIVENEEKSFVYINKNGCHFNYDSSYPSDKNLYNPTWSQSKTKEGLINSYKNCIDWSVDVFFSELSLAIKDKDFVVIYTSDHGQSLLDDGNTGTHNRTEAALPVEGNVPIFIYSPKLLDKKNSLPYIKENINKASAENIFPTILDYLGFDSEKLNNSISLHQILPEKKRFFVAGNIWGIGNYKIVKFD